MHQQLGYFRYAVSVLPAFCSHILVYACIEGSTGIMQEKRRTPPSVGCNTCETGGQTPRPLQYAGLFDWEKKAALPPLFFFSGETRLAKEKGLKRDWVRPLFFIYFNVRVYTTGTCEHPEARHAESSYYRNPSPAPTASSVIPSLLTLLIYTQQNNFRINQ